MPDAPSDTPVGLLIDLENLVLAFQDKNRRPKVPLAPVVEFLEDSFGDVILRRAYADWSNPSFGRQQDELQDLGVEMIHVRQRTPTSKKNGADILLTADAVECLLLRPFVKIFAIVSGDSDIGPLINKLKQHGKTVVVVGPDKKSTARHVIELADRFKYYHDIAGLPVSSSAKSRSSKKRRTPRKKSPQDMVKRILREAKEPVESANLKRQLMAKRGYGDFSEKALGFRSWTAFLNSIDGVAVDRQSDLGIEVSLG